MKMKKIYESPRAELLLLSAVCEYEGGEVGIYSQVVKEDELSNRAGIDDEDDDEGGDVWSATSLMNINMNKNALSDKCD